MKKFFSLLLIITLLFSFGAGQKNNALYAQNTINSDSICIASNYFLSLSVSSVSCPGTSTGTATVASTGCVCMFSGCLYTWSNGQTTHTAAGLPAGDYEVTVTHPNGCVLDTSLIINEPSPFVEALISSNATCNGISNGVATIVPSETAGTLSYAWSTGDTLNTVSNLAAGAYQVSVTNFINCQEVLPVTINEPPALSMGVAASPSCANASTGTITPSAIGGTPPYSYACSEMGSTQIITETEQLSPGLYSLTVTDSNGCIDMANATVNALSAPQVLVNAPNPNICLGQSTQIIAAVQGGGATFVWSPAVGLSSTTSNAPIASPITTTTYSVTAHYPNGCSAIASITITVEVCSDVEELNTLKATPQVVSNFAGRELKVLLPAGFLADNMSLYNLMGQQLQTINLNGTTDSNNASAHIIDMNNLPKGAYVLSFANNHTTQPTTIKVVYF